MSSLGSKIDHLHTLREKKRALEKEAESISQEMKLREDELIQEMQASGLSKMTGSKATVSISESVKPNVQDWDSFYKFIARHKYFHLLERRPSVTGCRELFETRGKIPGVVPFVLRSLNLRTLE